MIKKKRYLTKPKDATFRQRVARNILIDDAIHGGIVDKIKSQKEKREQILVKNGVSLPSHIQEDLSITEDRDALIDNLLIEYNKNPDNKEKLLTTNEIEQEVISSFFPNNNVNFDTKGILDKIKELSANIVAFTINNPAEVISNFGIGAIASLGFLAVPPAYAAIIADIVITGAFEYNRAAKQKQTYETLSKENNKSIGLEDIDVNDEALKNTLAVLGTSAVVSRPIGAAVSGIFKGGKYLLSSAHRLSTGKNAKLKNTPSIPGNSSGKDISYIKDIAANIEKFANNATPEERAQFILAAKQKRPSSILSNEQKIQVEKDIVRYTEASLENNKTKMDNVLTEPNMPLVSDEAKSIAIKEASNLSGTDLSEISLSEVKSLAEDYSKITNTMSNNRKIDVDFGTNAENFNKLWNEHTDIIFPNLSKANEIEGNALKKLNQAVHNILRNDIKLNLSSYTAKEISSFKTKQQRNAALSFNTALRRAEYSEALIGSVSSRSKTSKGTLNAAFNTYLESIKDNIDNNLMPKIKKLGGAISEATRGQSDKIDVAEFFDVVHGKSNKTRMLSVKNAWDETTKVIENLSTEAGLDLGVKGTYFPNRWSKNKMIGKKPEFVTDMLNAVDITAMQKLTDREVNATFFEKMFNAITNNDTSKSERVVVLKDGESWKAMHEKYGSLETVEDVLIAFGGGAKNKIFSQLIGSEDSAYVSSQINTVRDIILGNTTDSGKRDAVIKSADELYKTITDFTPVQTSVNSFFDKVISALMYAKTGGAAITAFLTDRFITMPIAINGAGLSKAPFLNSIKLLGSLTKRELKDLHNISSNSIRDIRRIAHEATKTKSALNAVTGSFKSLYDAPSKLLTHVAESNEIYSSYTLGSGISRALEKDFNTLPENLAKFLNESGFTSETWKFLKTVEPAYLSNETPIISSRLIDKYIKNGKFDSSSVPLAKAARNQLSHLETSFTLMATPRGTILGSTVAPNSRSNVLNAFLKTNFPFTNIAYSIWQHSVVESINRFGGKRFAAGAIVGAILAFSANSIIRRGKLPDFTDPNEYYRMASFMGAFGVTSIVFDEIFGVRYSDIYSISNSIKQIYSGNLYKGMSGLTQRFNPYSNFTLMGTLLSSTINDYVFSILDPDGAMQYDKELRKKLNNGTISDLYYLAKRPKNLR